MKHMVMTGPNPSIFRWYLEHPAFAINLFVFNLVIALLGLSYYVTTQMHHKKIAHVILMTFFSTIILIGVLIFYTVFYKMLV